MTDCERVGGKGELASDIFGCDPDCATLLADRADSAFSRGVSMATSGARPTFHAQASLQTLRTGNAPRSTFPQMEISGRVVFDLSLGASRATTEHADGTRSTKPKSDGAPRATFLSEKFRRRPSCSDQLRAACAIWPLAHPPSRRRNRLSVCVRGKALTEDAASGRRKAPLSVLPLVNGA